MADRGPPAALVLPPSKVLPYGDSLILSPDLKLPENATLNWVLAAGDTCFACPELRLRPTGSFRLTAYLADYPDCPVATEYRVLVDRSDLVYVPNTFSPNDDGVNDRFAAFPGPGVDRVLGLEVYDRWGKQVFSGAETGWDGRDAPPGVYVYRLTMRLFSGDLTLLR